MIYRLKTEYAYDFDILISTPEFIEGEEVALNIFKNGRNTRIAKRIVHFSKKNGLYIIFKNKIYTYEMFYVIWLT